LSIARATDQQQRAGPRRGRDSAQSARIYEHHHHATNRDTEQGNGKRANRCKWKEANDRQVSER
jgi:hypothetical protein